MESIIVAAITGVVTLVGVILSNSKSRAVMEVKLDALTAKVEKHNQVPERAYLSAECLVSLSPSPTREGQSILRTRRSAD